MGPSLLKLIPGRLSKTMSKSISPKKVSEDKVYNCSDVCPKVTFVSEKTNNVRVYVNVPVENCRIFLGNELVLTKAAGKWSVYCNEPMTMASLEKAPKNKNNEYIIPALFIDQDYATMTVSVEYDEKIHKKFEIFKYRKNDEEAQKKIIESFKDIKDVWPMPVYMEKELIDTDSIDYYFAACKKDANLYVKKPIGHVLGFFPKVIREWINNNPHFVKE